MCACCFAGCFRCTLQSTQEGLRRGCAPLHPHLLFLKRVGRKRRHVRSGKSPYCRIFGTARAITSRRNCLGFYFVCWVAQRARFSRSKNRPGDFPALSIVALVAATWLRNASPCRACNFQFGGCGEEKVKFSELKNFVRKPRRGCPPAFAALRQKRGNNPSAPCGAKRCFPPTSHFLPRSHQTESTMPCKAKHCAAKWRRPGRQ